MEEEKLNKKLTLRERAFEKLGFAQRFKSHSLDGTSTLSQSAPDHERLDLFFTGSSKDTGTDHRSHTVWYALNNGDMESKTSTTHGLMSGPRAVTQDKKTKKIRPVGTLEYTVKDRDTLERIAASYELTPSALTKLNKLPSRFIYPGQILYIPDESYSPPDEKKCPSSPVQEPRPFMDVPIVKLADKPPEFVPGHVERQTPVSSPTDQAHFEPPHKLSEEDVQKLDQECFERFIKVNVKHITDGQGVVNGVLLVTPNAVMFDPNVSDPLVLEHGPERYGMIAPMDMIVSAAMYHDIAAMKLRGQKNEDGTRTERPEVYHDKNCPLYQSLMELRGTEKDPDSKNRMESTDQPDSMRKASRSSTVNSELSEAGSVCSCGVSERVADLSTPDADPTNQNATSKETLKEGERSKDSLKDSIFQDNIGMSNETDILISAAGSTNQAQVLTSHDSAGPTVSDSKCVADNRTSVKGDEVGETTRLGEPVKYASFKLSTSPDDMLLDLSEPAEQANESRLNVQKDDNDDDALIDVSGNDVKLNQGTDDVELLVLEGIVGSDKLSYDNDDSAFEESKAGRQQANVNAILEETHAQMRIGNIVYLPVEEDSQGHITLKGVEETQAALSKLSTKEFRTRTLSEPVRIPAKRELTPESSASSFGSFRPAAQMSAFVNYATGLFRAGSSVKDITELVPQQGQDEKDSAWKLGTSPKERLEVENAVKLADKPELFLSFDKLIPRPASLFEDPPLYLCLRLGLPVNKQISHTCPIQSYAKKKKKPEYWFSIPRDKVDHLYAFFVQWTPSIYGKEDIELDAEKRGFIVINEDDQEDDDLDILDEYFGAHSSFQKDWEIVSRTEIKRRSIVLEEPMPLPDLIGKSSVLTEYHIYEINNNMPPRTIGYPWTLIYSTEKHGFSLKTLYRDMHGIDSPILLVVQDTRDNIFGALTSCSLMCSEHFYGTGESFLFTFYPAFKVFRWSGENNFFMKGNKESLAIGAGQGVFGLWFDEDLYHGRTQHCDTYDNDVLTESEDFVFKSLEAWAFI